MNFSPITLGTAGLGIHSIRACRRSIGRSGAAPEDIKPNRPPAVPPAPETEEDQILKREELDNAA